jgi:uncharacterized protein (TIGR00255 family)
MALASMTGFARADGVTAVYQWAWELKSVNAKGMDLRLRLPVGWDALEAPVRARASEMLTRGSIYATLSVERTGIEPVVRVNESVLAAVLVALKGLSDRIEAEAPRLDGILAIKGVIEVVDADENEQERHNADTAILDGFGRALVQLAQMRGHEGDVLGRILLARLSEIAALTAQAEKTPGRHPNAIKQRLADQIGTLLENSSRLDPDRLYQEAILLAAKADVREELDRLNAHVAQARKLIANGGAIGRRLDFLAQEFNRESNTLCAKSSDIELTNIGLELKTVVEQFREQVQNLE